MVTLYAQTTATAPTQGNGSEANPYQIENLAHLRWLSENEDDVWDKHFVQTADIDASETGTWNEGTGFSPIGNTTAYFTGTYNGDYKIISNLTIKYPDTDYIGLFGCIDSATIKKLQLENVVVEGKDYVGGMLGYSLNNCIISQVSVTGSIRGDVCVGGICGYSRDNTTIKESCSNATIAGNRIVGGILGYSLFKNEIISCYSFSTISAVEVGLGGIVGRKNSYKIIMNCYFAGVFIGENSDKGGIISYGSWGKTDKGNLWDREKTGIESTIDNGKGKTSAEMRNPLTFIDEGWDFKLKNKVNYIWNINSHINDGYPFFDWQYPDENELDIQLQPIFTIEEATITSSTEMDIKVFMHFVGNPVVSEIGVCYGLDELPEKNVDNTEKWMGNIEEGEITLSISNLDPAEIYYFRVYAVNSEGVYYADNIAITFVIEQEPKGKGSYREPYLISNFNELLWTSNHIESTYKYYKQTDDIDATPSKGLNNGKGFKPIGNEYNTFYGSYDGSYHKIENLYINRPLETFVGLFGSSNFSTIIKRLRLEDVDIEGDEHVGGLVGANVDESVISQVSVTGRIMGTTTDIGGICGTNEYSTIEESFSNAEIYYKFLKGGSVGWSSSGGIVGRNNGGTIANCYSLSPFYSQNGSVGGIAGYSEDGIVVNNYFAGFFEEGDYIIGGIIGSGTKTNTGSGNFWDSEKCEVTINVGNGTAITTAETKDVQTFVDAGWDFKLKNKIDYSWNINSHINGGYPFLDWQYPDEGEIDDKIFPIFSIKEVSIISSTQVDIKIIMSYVGNPAITETGVCYGLNELPEKDVDFTVKKNENIEEGEIVLSVTNIDASKLYYLRAYAVNSE